MLKLLISLMYILTYIIMRLHEWKIKTKLHRVGSTSKVTGTNTYRHSLFLEKAFVQDSLFPLKPGENLTAK
jgi:hypothetical protein